MDGWPVGPTDDVEELMDEVGGVRRARGEPGKARVQERRGDRNHVIGRGQQVVRQGDESVGVAGEVVVDDDAAGGSRSEAGRCGCAHRSEASPTDRVLGVESSVAAGVVLAP